MPGDASDPDGDPIALVEETGCVYPTGDGDWSKVNNAANTVVCVDPGGVYEFTIPKEVGVVATVTYTAKVRAVSVSGTQREWAETINAVAGEA